MWPFNLPGPSFLLFYLCFGLGSLLVFHLLQRQREASDETRKRQASRSLTDPYAIAFMRGGEAEALRVAVVSLIDRDLLIADDDKISTPGRRDFSSARRPIEKAVVTACAKRASTFDDLARDAGVKAACVGLERDLQKQGLRASSDTYRARLPLFWAFFGALGFVAAVKIVNALMTGRTNILFLIILAVVFLAGLAFVWRRKKTGLGQAVMGDMRTLFSGLKSRAATLKSGGGSTEAVMLAAVFGVAALPAAEFPYVKKLFPAPSTTEGGGDSSGSSSCGSSGGSGCGGGGGCGGCGG